MTANYVEILVKSNDQAKPDVAALKAQLADLGRQVATARAQVDDAEGAAKLDALKAKLIDLGKRTANPKISMAGAVRAESQVHGVEAELAKLSASSDDAGSHLDRLKAKLSGSGNEAQTASSRFAALRGALNQFVTGGLSGGIGEMGTFQKAMFAMNVATGVGEPAVAGLTVAVGGLAAGLASAGAGVGLFGIVAKQVWTQTTTAMTAYQTAATAAAAATTKASRTADLKAEKTALDGMSGAQRQLATSITQSKNAWNGFVAAAAPGVSGVMAQAMAMIPRALSLIKPILAPVELAISTLLTDLQGAEWSKGLQSFITMISANAGPAILKLGTAIGHIAVGVGGILKAFMPVSQGMMSGLDKITAKFAAWGSSLSGHSGFKSLETMAKADVPVLINALKQLGSIAKIVGSQMSSMSTFGNSHQLLEMADAVLKFANSLLKAHPGLVNLILYAKLSADTLGRLKTAFSGVSAGVTGIKGAVDGLGLLRKGAQGAEVEAEQAESAWYSFGGKLSSVGGAMKSAFSSIGSGLASAASSVAQFAAQTARQLAMAARATIAWVAEHAVAAGAFITENVAMAASATAAFIAENAATLGLVVVIAALIAAIIYLATHWKQVWADIQKVALAAWHFIDDSLIHPLEAGVGALVDWVKSHFALLATIIATVLFGPIGLLVAFVVTHWDEIKSETGKLVSGVVSFFESLPGKIMSAIASLPGLLFRAGANIIHMLASGIESAIGAVTGAIGHIASEITSHLPFSPARKGPLSGAGSPQLSGAKIPQMLAAGMSGGLGPVQQAAARMARAAGLQAGGMGGGGYGAAAAGAGGPQQIQLIFSGGDQLSNQLLQAMRKEVRTRGGGNVQRVLGVGG